MNNRISYFRFASIGFLPVSGLQESVEYTQPILEMALVFLDLSE